jgi:hypothetical protein
MGGLSDEAAERLFHDDRAKRYAAFAAAVRGLLRTSGRKRGPDGTEAMLRRLRKLLEEIVAIDFFGPSGRQSAEALLAKLEGTMKGKPLCERVHLEARATIRSRMGHPRRNQIDRMASAWLIRRFIDQEAAFKFVPGKEYAPGKGELQSDMFEGAFTHEGDLCTFEDEVTA